MAKKICQEEVAAEQHCSLVQLNVDGSDLTFVGYFLMCEHTGAANMLITLQWTVLRGFSSHAKRLGPCVNPGEWEAP
jgi:hypothetical protein